MLGLVLDGLRPGLSLTLSRKTGRRWKRILTYRRLLSAMAQSALKVICCPRRRDPSLKTFCSMCAGFSGRRPKTKRPEESAPPWPGLIERRSSINRQRTGRLRQNLRTSGKNFGEEGKWSPAMALDASQIGTRSENRSYNICLLYHSTVIKCEPLERGARRNRKASKRRK